MLGVRKARRAARMYYLDCMPISSIMRELDCSRKDVIDAIDDPGRQQHYVDEAAKLRKRLRARAAAAAEAAMEKQVEFVGTEQTESALIVEQQRAAARLLRAGMEGEKDGTVRIIFENGMPKLGMPPSRDYRESSHEQPAADAPQGVGSIMIEDGC